MDVPTPEIESESDEVVTARRRRAPGPVCALALAACVAAGCQSYEPLPLDPAAHREAWHGRTLEAASLRAFLERLELAPSDRVDELDPADGLSLDEGRLVALVFNPELRLARLRVARASAGAGDAGRWQDPQLSFDVLRVAESVPDPWVVSAGLAFSIPLSGRLAAERGLAAAEQRVAERAAREAEWNVRHDVERAWIDWSAKRLRLEETRRLVGALDGLVRTAAQLEESGELQRTEAALFRVEQGQRRNEVLWLRGEVAAGEQRLRGLLGLAPEAPVAFEPTLELPVEPAPRDVDAPALIEARHPSLARLREAYQVSEESLRREIAKQIPDLTLGPSFESDEGQSRVGFLGTIPMPFLNANRRAIAEARVEREIARAALETEYEVLVGRWATARARAEALAAQRADLERVLVPLVDRQLEDALRLLRLGEETSLVLLESLARAHQTKLALIDTRSAESVARAEQAFLLGPEPAAGPSDAKPSKPRQNP